MEDKSIHEVAMHVTRGCLVVSIQIELQDETARQIQGDILKRVETSGIKGVIMDFSTIDIIDSFLAQTIFDTAKMASLLGATTVITGLKSGVIVSLIDLDIDLEGLRTARTLEDAFEELKPIVEPEITSDSDEIIESGPEEIDDSESEYEPDEDIIPDETEEADYETDEDLPDTEDEEMENAEDEIVESELSDES